MKATPPPRTVARFALKSEVPASVTGTLPMAERARRTAMGCYRRIEERRLYGDKAPEGAALPRSIVFSGKDADGVPLRGHGHAFYWPTDEDGDGWLDRLTIYAPMGFGLVETRALERLRKFRMRECGTLELALLAIGNDEAIAAGGLFGPSRVWVSVTPFLATRHAKRRGRKRDPAEWFEPGRRTDFAQQVLLEEWARLRTRRPEIPDPERVERLPSAGLFAGRALRVDDFKRFRRKPGDDGDCRAAGLFRLVFAEPLRGPLCLGHSAHFGMGLFRAEFPSPSS